MIEVINPRRACAASPRFTAVALIVCLSVITLAAASLGSTLRKGTYYSFNMLFSVLTRGYSPFQSYDVIYLLQR